MARQKRISGRESPLGARVIARPKVIEAGFVVALLFGELLPYSIARAVPLRRRASTRTGEEFLTERQLEDAATPHLTRHARALFSFQRARQQFCN